MMLERRWSDNIALIPPSRTVNEAIYIAITYDSRNHETRMQPKFVSYAAG